MSKNPIVNAGLASVYIVVLVSFLFYVPPLFVAKEDTALIPIVMLSLFTLSAAVMAYLFCYQPLALFLEGKRQEAVRLFLQTVAVFAGITACLGIVLFLIR